MRAHPFATRLRGAFVAAMAVAATSCGSSPITSIRIDAAVQSTFANLVELQLSRLGLPPMTASDFAVTAICHKQAAGSNEGSGEWVCTLAWQGPGRRKLHDTYDLFVGTDGCYTATVSGESLGGPILKAADGSDVRNLLYRFEGCFDTT